jgi:predicted DNA-binding mobile mystery protein A
MDSKKLRRQQAHNRLEKIRALKPLLKGIPSWVYYIRTALGMKAEQLAERAGLKSSTIYQTERMEREGRVTLNKLKQLADAMNCDLVYGFVPREPLKDMIQHQAELKAKEIVQHSHLHMELEDQANDQQQLREQILDLANNLVDDKTLWDRIKSPRGAK